MGVDAGVTSVHTGVTFSPRGMPHNLSQNVKHVHIILSLLYDTSINARFAGVDAGVTPVHMGVTFFPRGMSHNLSHNVKHVHIILTLLYDLENQDCGLSLDLV